MSVIDWTVRSATVADVEALALIGAATFLETFAGVLDGAAIVAHCAVAHSSDAYLGYLHSGGQAWLAEAEPGNAPVGYALLAQPDLAAARAGDIELKRIYVLSRLHGSGCGAVLMAAAITAGTGHNRLLLGVYAGNLRAQSFYAKQDFTKIGERRFEVGGKLYDDVVFARPLET